MSGEFPAQCFEKHRDHLRTVEFRILGSSRDADDASAARIANRHPAFPGRGDVTGAGVEAPLCNARIRVRQSRWSPRP